MEKVKKDIYFKLMIAQISILLAIAAGSLTWFTFINSRNNASNAAVVTSVNKLSLAIKVDYYDKVLPAYNLSIKNNKEIYLLKNNIHKTDSLFQVTNSNVIRLLDWVRNKNGKNFAD